jgi:hypothetical protein
MLRYHLKRNHCTRLPGALVVVDTESEATPDPAEPATTYYPLRLGVARFCRIERGRATRRQTFRFTRVKQFWDWLRSRMDARRPLWLWAHNLGWDLTVLRFWEEIEAGRFTFTGPNRRVYDAAARTFVKEPTPGLLITQDPPTALVCWDKAGRTLKGCDTVNWFPRPLADIGRMTGLEKIEFPGTSASERELWPYCERDCEITERAVLELLGLLRDIDAGNMRFTPAGQAFACYRHWDQVAPIEFNADPDVCAFERETYFGGRKAVFFAGRVLAPDAFTLEGDTDARKRVPLEFGGPVYHLDLTAAYASVMHGNRFPFKLYHKDVNPQLGLVERTMKDSAAVAVVQIDSPDVPYPYRRKDRVEWCIGRFATGLAGPELARALERGHVKAVWRIFYYRQARLFDEFVEKMTALEQRYGREDNAVRRALVKSMRNGLYGKFGQWDRGWAVSPGATYHKKWGQFGWYQIGGEGVKRCRAVGGEVQERLDGPRVDWTFPAIPAYVTSYCRLRMDALRERAGLAHVYYQDADSLHVGREALARLQRLGDLAEDTPGKLRIVAVAQDVLYKGPKHYVWDGDVVNAGLPTKAVATGPGQYVCEEFQRLNSTLNHAPPVGGVVREKSLHEPTHPLGAERTRSGWTQPIRFRGAGDSPGSSS